MRKSKEQRLEDVRKAIAQWEATGLGADRRLGFMRESLLALQRGKSLTTKQREWLDALCAEGPPAPKGDPALLARIDAALPHADPRNGGTILREFRHRITMGWTLSEKQAAFMAGLLADAERIAREGRWTPDPDLRAKADFACGVLGGRSSTWKGTHPGTMEACSRYSEWCKDPESHFIDERTVNKILAACGPAVREFERPKFEQGEMVVIDVGFIDVPRSWGVVCSRPVPLNGAVGYEVLTEGKPVLCAGDTIKRMK
jgi:hypothetical protein